MLLHTVLRGTALLLCAFGTAAHAQSARVTISPARPAPGAIVQLTLHLSTAAEPAGITGTMASEPLHFVSTSIGRWTALAGIPADAADTVEAHVFISREGTTDTASAAVVIPRSPAARKGRARPERLGVAARFSRPMDSATAARVARENERAREIARNAHHTQRMWSGPFTLPRASRITSSFGTGRLFNGTVRSRHLGVDLAGAVGAPVHAANRGVVALVDEFFLGGNVVYLDHGNGIVTGYLHLSSTTVAQGDTVARGQQIGSVGATGRVTGPHLHWTARYGAITVNPLDLVAVTRGRIRSNAGQ